MATRSRAYFPAFSEKRLGSAGGWETGQGRARDETKRRPTYILNIRTLLALVSIGRSSIALPFRERSAAAVTHTHIGWSVKVACSL